MQANEIEKHLTTTEIARAWSVATEVVCRIFEDEPGVLRLGATTSRRRTRRELRIPVSVYNRVYQSRLSQS
jgi:hypothetical protein